MSQENSSSNNNNNSDNPLTSCRIDGDKKTSPSAHSFQNLIYTFLGGIFYIALGSIQLDTGDESSTHIALGVIAIITGIVFFVDIVLMMIQAKKERE